MSVLREGYTLPFKQGPLFDKVPPVQSGYANPVKNRFLKEILLNLMSKLVVEQLVVSSVAFYNRLFLAPKPNRKWRATLDLSQLNLYLSTNTFKMETPETIRLSLQTGEWVTSLDFSDAYFHIPINQRSQKYLEVFPLQSDLPIHSSPLWSGHSSPRVYKGGQGSETDGTSKGYPNPPVPRRLVTESPVPGNLPTTYPDPLGPSPTIRVGCKHEKVRTNLPTGLQFRRLLVRPGNRSGPTHSGPVDSPPRKVEVHQNLENCTVSSCL